MRIGVDVGGTKILGVLVDGKHVHKKIQVPTPKSGKNTVVAAIAGVVSSLSEKKLPVGVGLPGYVHHGQLFSCPNIPSFERVKVKGLLEKAIGRKIAIENDANCFALAEHRFGSGRGFSHMVGVILGTGAGAGIIIHNKLYRGAIGGAGEFGHVHLGKKRFELVISGPGITQRYKEAYGEIKEPKEIFKNKDKISVRVQEEVLDDIGRFLSMLIDGLNPEVVVIGGGVSNLPFYREIRAAAKKYSLPAQYKCCVIKKASVPYAGAVGAAML